MDDANQIRNIDTVNNSQINLEMSFLYFIL